MAVKWNNGELAKGWCSKLTGSLVGGFPHGLVTFSFVFFLPPKNQDNQVKVPSKASKLRVPFRQFQI
jgi:predicted component of type VI protein secretion system